MRLLWHLLSVVSTLSIVNAKQHPLHIPQTRQTPEHDVFTPIGIIDVGAGPQYREYKRYLSISPSSFSVFGAETPLSIRSVPRNTTQHSNSSREAISNAITQSRFATSTQSPAIPWTTKEILIPDVTDLVTVTTLAKIANNAYIEVPRTFDWIDVGAPWNLSSDFGWEKNGLRGHVFASEKNETIIISLKGTSPAVFLGGGTGGNDKVNVPPLQMTLMAG
jgi:putative lipase involved disintegration of autophagic bodies